MAADGMGVGSWVRACGDSFHIRFVSTRSLSSPSSEVEVDCGVHQLGFILPPDSPTLSPDVWLARYAFQLTCPPDVSSICPPRGIFPLTFHFPHVSRSTWTGRA